MSYTCVHSFACKICNKTFRLRSNLKQHLLYHSGEGPPVYCCQQCGKIFYEEYELINHDKSHIQIQSAVKPYVCKFRRCGKMFSRRHYLMKHHEDVHKLHQEKLFACKYSNCGKKFRRRQNLGTHTLYHTGIKRCVHSTKLWEELFHHK